MVMPFENTSKAPGIDWIGEAFAELLGQRLNAAQLFSISRADRVYALERLGLPGNMHPSRATLVRVAEEMDVDYLVLGSYDFDGHAFTARTQLMEVRRLRLQPETVESGALTQLTELMNAQAWNLVRMLDPLFASSKNEYVAQSSPVRLDALENYIRGVISTTRNEKIKYYLKAVRLNPLYTQALLQLGKTYYDARDYEQAMAWLSKVAKNEVLASEASFYFGLSAYYLGRFDKAEEAFTETATHMPLIEVYNNIGVAAARRGKANAIDRFRHAVEADSRDADYRFNLAIALYRSGNNQEAARQLKEAFLAHPEDAEAKALFDQVNSGAPFPTAGQRLPLERIKQNYDETSYRELLLALQTVNEERYAGMSRTDHANGHIKRGNEMLEQGLAPQAEADFREAILLAPGLAAAHSGLAHALEAQEQVTEARTEAQAANRIQPLVAAFLVLARIDLKQNKTDAALESVERALRIEPANATAADLKRAINEQKAGKHAETDPGQ